LGQFALFKLDQNFLHNASLEPGHETIPPPDEAIFVATRKPPETNAVYSQGTRK
jgi:hypothetical protein